MSSRIKTYISSILLGLWFLPVKVFAQIHAPLPQFFPDPTGTLPGVDYTISQSKDVELLLIKILNFFLGFVGVIALIMFVVGGWWFLTAGGNEEQTTKGKKTILYSIIGIIVILISYAAVATLTGAAETGFGANGGSGPGCFPPFC